MTIFWLRARVDHGVGTWFRAGKRQYAHCIVSREPGYMLDGCPLSVNFLPTHAALMQPHPHIHTCMHGSSHGSSDHQLSRVVQGMCTSCSLISPPCRSPGRRTAPCDMPSPHESPVRAAYSSLHFGCDLPLSHSRYSLPSLLNALRYYSC